MLRPRLLLAAVAVLLTVASPAGAHGGGDETPSAGNHRSTVTAVDPPHDGLHWRTIDASTRVEVVNETGEELVVMGTEGEPYLRIGPDGVHENQLSVTAFRSANPPDAPLPQQVLTGGVEWREVSSSPSWAWHDDRAHASEDPSDWPSEFEWQIDATLGGEPVVIRGEVRWVSPPPLWPSLLGITAVALVLGLLGWRGWSGAAIAIASLTCVAVTVLRLVGTWTASAAPALSKLEPYVVPAVAWLFLAASIVRYLRSPRDAVMLATGATVGIGVLFGAASWTWLGNSQLPTGLEAWAGRATVVAALGAAIGMLLVAAISWSRETPAAR